MTRFIALLRGVNVGGVTIRSAELAQLFRVLGFDSVKTVLASGNVVFESNEKADALKPRIEGALGERFGYEAWVHVLTSERMRALVDAYPFPQREGWHAYVIFTLTEEPRDRALGLELDPALETVAAGEGVVYWSVERGRTLTSAVAKASAPARFRATTTTRNLRTLRKLL